MTDWGSIRAIRVGGLVAVGLLDERRVLIGSHSGLGVIDAATGAVLDRVADSGGYAWFKGTPPTALYTDEDGQHDVPVVGLWGGNLLATTSDGWDCRTEKAGATLTAPDGSLTKVDDHEEPRACGFSPHGQVFIFATSSTLYVAVRTPI